MSSFPSRLSAGDAPTADPYVPVEEVARRLDLPLGVLLRRVEAGDVPARRVEGPDGVHYSVRLSDLGVHIDEAQTEPVAAEPLAEEHSNAASGKIAEPESVTPVDVIGSVALPSSWPDKVVPPPSEELAAVSSPRAPAADLEAHDGSAAGRNDVAPRGAPASIAATDKPAPPPDQPAERPAGGPVRPQRGGDRDTRLSTTRLEPKQEVANMALDPRELVAGLLDRWERTLEQRIYVEQRQRFETELNARQNLLKQLQLELQTARAEHAAAQAEKDRDLAQRLRQVADLQRDLNVSKDEAKRRRGWFGRR